ncbi:MAG: helix-turn-helix domain-containing protein [Mangrovibacterium sp.]
MITSLEPNAVDTGRYSQNETCEILGISRVTLWSHTNAGLIKFGIRKSNRRKFYTGFEIKRYWKAQY